MPFDFEPLEIPDVIRIIPRVFGDARGFFLESYHRPAFCEAGIECVFMQDNHSKSARGVVRGLHYQNPAPQAKLVRVVQGRIFDVAVDIRRNSSTFGKSVSLCLDAREHHAVFIPRGFAHGFAVLSETAEVLYKTDNVYAPDCEHGILWNDPEIAINWPVDSPVLSEKDAALPRLDETRPESLPG
jgi:dTDP-4-dehydrorhamnose 3,5-epimerase